MQVSFEFELGQFYQNAPGLQVEGDGLKKSQNFEIIVLVITSVSIFLRRTLPVNH